MKGFGALIVILAVGWLAWPEGGDEMAGDEVVTSSRRVSKRAGMTRSVSGNSLEEMEIFAANLSDEELWEEIERECEGWLKEAERYPWSRPSDWIVMLAREIGARGGEEGVIELANFLEGVEKELQSEVFETTNTNIQKLAVSLGYASFGGWSSARPAEAIGWVVKGEMVNWSERGDKPPLVFINPMGFPGSELMFGLQIRAGERVLRAAFEDLSVEDPDLAITLFARGVRSLTLDPNHGFEAIEPALDLRQKAMLLGLLSDTETGVEFFKRELWNGEGVPALERVRDDRTGRLDEMLARVEPELAKKLIFDSSWNLDSQKGLCQWLIFQHPEEMEIVGAFDPDFQWDILAILSGDLSMASFGPIDGKSGGMLDDLPGFYRELKEVIAKSDLVPDQKSDLIGRMEGKFRSE